MVRPIRQYQAEPKRRPNYVVDGYLVIGEPPRRSSTRWLWAIGLVVATVIVVLFVIVTSGGGRFGL